MNFKPQQYFLLFLIVLTGALSFFIFSPFITTLTLAVIGAVVFQPIFTGFTQKFKGHRSLSAFVTIALIALIIIIPLTLLGVQLVHEATALYSSMVTSGNSASLNAWGSKIISDFSAYIPSLKGLNVDLSSYAEQGLALLLKNAVPLFSNVVTILLNAVIFLMALYFLLRDGDSLTETMIRLSPLPDADDRKILHSLQQSVHSVVTGNLLTALVQGFVATIGFLIFGLPHAILFGVITAVTALIPGIGTSLVVIPAILFLAATGHVGAALGLLVWGMFAVGLIDNFLGPRLVGRGMKLHPIIIFLSVIGGLSFFGPFGFLFGPLVVSLFFTLTEFFFVETK